jgi:hypothetical protein
MFWVDITNLPHVLFFKDFIKSHEVLVTARDFGALTKLLDLHGIEYVAVGKHGGRSPVEKLIESARRTLELAEVVSKEDIETAVSKQSVEMPRVAFGLGIPAVQVIDNEYAEEQNRLVLPLCTEIVVPDVLDYGRLLKQGASKERIRRFKGLCEVAHVKNFKPDESSLGRLGGDYVLVRPEPYLAAYFKGGVKTQELIDALRGLDLRVVVLPRSGERYEGAENLEGVDSLGLIYYAKAVLSGGGTMNRESALLGTPTISFYPQDLLGVDRYLIEQGLMYHATTTRGILKLVERVMDKKQESRQKAREILKGLEDPFELIESII